MLDRAYAIAGEILAELRRIRELLEQLVRERDRAER
jgi:hypothetical protein